MSKRAWKNQEKIFHKALGLSGTERENFLQKACALDEKQMSEVRSLLRAFENKAGFLDKPVFEDHLALLHEIDSDHLENSEISSYRIRSRIGEGGMGKVYDATDVRLNRRVALKFLSESFEDDNLARRRLLREAQAAAMLDHPNICAIYGIEQIEEHHFIVMQYVDGVTLADLIAKPLVDPKVVLEIFRQIASAVAFAHSHGIIHRDLKPANIMIKADSQIKILDFGLAKNVGPNGGRDGNLSSRISQNGLIIGTVSYMSPEQLRGERLDFQTDIFSIGIILYELISGKNPFARNSRAETIASVLGEEPASLTDLDQHVSDGLSTIVRKCLEKDKAKRFQSVAEILIDLETISPYRKKVSGRRRKRKPMLLAAILLFLALSAITAFLYFPVPARASRSLAILPISNESGDPANDYLSEGLTESLASRLSGLSQIKVTPPGLVSRYKGQDADPKTVGNDLKVTMVMKARVLKRDDSLFLEASLLKTDNGERILDREFRIDKADLLISQEMIANLIVANIQITPSEEELDKLRKRQPGKSETSTDLFQGNYFLNNRSKENIEKAIACFDKVINSEPSHAKAWARKAEALVVQSSPAYGSLTPKIAMNRAQDAAKKALELDETLCEAHNAMGLIRFKYDWNWEAAEKSFLRAIEINPEYAPAHYWYSYALVLKGDMPKAILEATRASELDPNTINSESNIGRMYYFRRESDKAIQLLTNILQRAPSDKNAAYLLGLNWLQTGRYQEALDIFEAFYQIDKKYFAAQLGYTYGRLNRKQDALQILREMDEISKEDIVPAQEFAIVYLGIGETDKAFELFNRSCQDRYAALPTILKEFYFDSLQNDKRFRDLKACVTPLN